MCYNGPAYRKGAYTFEFIFVSKLKEAQFILTVKGVTPLNLGRRQIINKN